MRDRATRERESAARLRGGKRRQAGPGCQREKERDSRAPAGEQGGTGPGVAVGPQGKEKRGRKRSGPRGRGSRPKREEGEKGRPGCGWAGFSSPFPFPFLFLS
jgi:hypothetical protein